MKHIYRLFLVSLIVVLMSLATGVLAQVSTPIGLGETVSGTLSENETRAVYTFQGSGGTTVTITLMSDDFDAYLVLQDSAGSTLAEDDDSAGQLNSLISFALPADGETLGVRHLNPGVKLTLRGLASGVPEIVAEDAIEWVALRNAGHDVALVVRLAPAAYKRVRMSAPWGVNFNDALRTTGQVEQLTLDRKHELVLIDVTTIADRVQGWLTPVESDHVLETVSAPESSPTNLTGRTKSAGKMNQILKACLGYAAEHQGNWPDDLQSLASYGIDKAKLVNPQNRQQVPGYVYRKPAASPTAPQASETIVLLEAYTAWPGGINVGFADGQVKFITDRTQVEATGK